VLFRLEGLNDSGDDTRLTMYALVGTVVPPNAEDVAGLGHAQAITDLTTFWQPPTSYVIMSGAPRSPLSTAWWSIPWDLEYLSLALSACQPPLHVGDAVVCSSEKAARKMFCGMEGLPDALACVHRLAP
jgi:hypothetical protein